MDREIIHQWTLPGDPYGLIHDDQHLYLCDSINHSILRYSLSTYQLLETWKSPLLTLNHPVAIDQSENELFIIDKTNQIFVFDLIKKSLTRQWSLPDLSYGIKVSQDEIFVTGYNKHQIYVYNRLGNLLTTFGDGKKTGLCNPQGITVDENFIYVCDSLNHVIQTLDRKTGIFTSQWGTKGTKDGQFLHPLSIYRSPSNGILYYISDVLSLQVWNQEGKFLCRMGKNVRGKNIGEFNGIYGVTGKENDIFISDTGNRRLQLWRIKLVQEK